MKTSVLSHQALGHDAVLEKEAAPRPGRVRLLKGTDWLYDADDEMILWYRAHPVEAVRDLCGWPTLSVVERLALREIWFKPHVLLGEGRGMAKTALLACAAVAGVLLYPGLKVGIIAPVFRQAKFVMSEIQGIWERSPFLRRAAHKAPHGVSFGNDRAALPVLGGGFIEALPLGDGTRVRGARYHWLFCDEQQNMDDEIMSRVIWPMAIVERGRGEERNKIVLAGTATGRWTQWWYTYLFYRYMALAEPDEYACCEFDYECLLDDPDPPYVYSTRELARQKMQMTPAEFGEEYRFRFGEDEGAFFTRRMIEEATPRKPDRHDQEVGIPVEWDGRDGEGHPKGLYVAGCDPARTAGGANCAFTVGRLQGHTIWATHVATLNGATFPEMTWAVRRLHDRFALRRLTIDAQPGGGGMAIRDLLAAPATDPETGKDYPGLVEVDAPDGLPGVRCLQMLKPTEAINTELAQRTKARLQEKTLLFPMEVLRDFDPRIQAAGEEIRELKREMIELVVRPKGGALHFAVARNRRMDRFSALLYMVEAAHQELEPRQAPPERMPGGFWIDMARRG